MIAFSQERLQSDAPWNKSESLKNGSIGTFKRVLDEDRLLVYCENVGNIAIDRVTWNQRNRQGEAIGVVHQFPLTPAYAVTCHTVYFILFIFLFIYLFIYLYTVKNSSGTINSKKCLEIQKSKILNLLLHYFTTLSYLQT